MAGFDFWTWASPDEVNDLRALDFERTAKESINKADASLWARDAGQLLDQSRTQFGDMIGGILNSARSAVAEPIEQAVQTTQRTAQSGQQAAEQFGSWATDRLSEARSKLPAYSEPAPEPSAPPTRDNWKQPDQRSERPRVAAESSGSGSALLDALNGPSPAKVTAQPDSAPPKPPDRPFATDTTVTRDDWRQEWRPQLYQETPNATPPWSGEDRGTVNPQLAPLDAALRQVQDLYGASRGNPNPGRSEYNGLYTDANQYGGNAVSATPHQIGINARDHLVGVMRDYWQANGGKEPDTDAGLSAIARTLSETMAHELGHDTDPEHTPRQAAVTKQISQADGSAGYQTIYAALKQMRESGDLTRVVETAKAGTSPNPNEVALKGAPAIGMSPMERGSSPLLDALNDTGNPDQPSGLSRVPEPSDNPTFAPEPEPGTLLPAAAPPDDRGWPGQVSDAAQHVAQGGLRKDLEDFLPKVGGAIDTAAREDPDRERRDRLNAAMEDSDLPEMAKIALRGMTTVGDAVVYLRNLADSAITTPIRDTVIKPLLKIAGAEQHVMTPLGEFGTADLVMGALPVVGNIGPGARAGGAMGSRAVSGVFGNDTLNQAFPSRVLEPAETLIGGIGQRILDSGPVQKAGEVLGGLRDAAGAMTRGLPGGAPAAGVVESDRYYHGTGGAYDRPNPATFDENGLFGPGYYLTSDPRVAGGLVDPHGNVLEEGYAQIDPVLEDANTLQYALDRYTKGRDSLGPGASQETRDSIDERIASIQKKLDILTGKTPTGPNVRAVDVPRDLRLVNADAPSQQDIHAIVSTLVKEFPGQEQKFMDLLSHPSREGWWEKLRTTLHWSPSDLNSLLADAGFDGIAHRGGLRMPINDEAGQPITHNVAIVFGQSLPKITNATSGRPGGLLPSQSAASPGQRLAGQAVGGAVAGGYSASQEPDATPGSVLQGAALGAAGGVARGAIGRRGTGQAIARVAERAGQEGNAPEGLPIRLSTPEEIARLRLDKFPEEARDEIRKAAEGVDWARDQRRGVLPDAVVAQMAEDLGRSVEQWLRVGKPGKAYNAEEIVALRGTLANQAVKVSDLTEQIAQARTAGTTPDLLIARRAAEAGKLAALTKVAEGQRAEAGRALRQYAQQVHLIETDPEQAIQRIYQRLGGRDNALQAVDEYTKLVQDSADPIKMAQFWSRVENPPPGFKDWFAALRYNSMLSGPRTFEVNVAGNLLEIPWRLGRDALASTARGRLGEMGPEVAGLWAGMGRGSQAFMETLAHGISAEAAAKGDLPRDITSRVSGPAKGAALALEWPGRIMQASDDFGRMAAYGMALGRRAAVIASHEKLSGDAWNARVAELVAAPPKDMMQWSLGVADRMTYHNEMGSLGQALAGVQRVPYIGNIVLPFLKTVYNITSRGIDRSPVGIVGTAIDVARGAYKDGAIPKGAVPLGERLGDNVMGGLAGVWFIDQAMRGNVSGAGPTDQNQREMLRSEGWQPYSLKVGGNWVSYANWGPVAVPLSLAAATAESQIYKKQGASLTDQARDTFERFAGLATEQTYLQSIGAVYKSLSEPDRYGGQWLTQFVQSLVPEGALLATVAQAQDPLQRRPEKGNIGQAVASRLPEQVARISPVGTRKDVPVATDVAGKPVPNQQSGAGALQPLRISRQRPSSTMTEFRRLGVDFPEVKATKLGDTPLSPTQQRQYRDSAQAIRGTLTEQVIASPTYQKADDAAKKRMLDAATSRASAWAGQAIVPSRDREGYEFTTSKIAKDPAKATAGYLRAVALQEQLRAAQATRYLGVKGAAAEQLMGDIRELGAFRQALGKAKGDLEFVRKVGASRYARADGAEVDPRYELLRDRVEASPDYQLYFGSRAVLDLGR